ncbi:MAG: hypothetical protein WCL28_07380 [bacterium]
MDSGYCSLYIVTTDTNAAVLKRLRGLGVAMGINVIPVSHSSELPSNPVSGDILLCPEHLLNSTSAVHRWPNVIIASSKLKSDQRNDFNTISCLGRDDQPLDWIQITTMTIKNLIKKTRPTPWFAIHHAISSKISTPSTEFAIWAAAYKNLSAIKLDRVIKTLRSLERPLIAPKFPPFTINIGVEPSTLHLELRIDDNRPFEIEKNTRLFDSLEFCQETTVSQHDGLMIRVALSLGAGKVSRITTCIVKPISTVLDNTSRREVS